MKADFSNPCMIEWKQRYSDVLYCFLMLVVYCLIYGLVMFRFGMLADEAADAFHEVNYVYVSNGRWLVYFWHLWFGRGVFPLVAGLVSGIAIVVGLLIQTRVLNIRQFATRCLYGCIYLSCVQWYFQLEFSCQSDVVGVSILMSSLSVYLLLQKGGLNTLAAILLVACSIACYQTSVMNSFLLMFAVWIQNQFASRSGMRDLLVYGALCCAGAFVWYVVMKLVQLAVLPSASSGGISSYQASYENWSTLALVDSLEMKVRVFLHHTVKVPLEKIMCIWEHPAQWVYTGSVIPMMILMVHAWRRLGKLRAVVVIIALGLVLYLPYWTDVLFLYEMPGRVHLAVPLSVALIWALLINNVNISPKCRQCLYCIGVMAVISAMYAVGGMARDEMYKYSRSKEEMLLMYVRGLEAADRAELEDCSIILLGSPEPPALKEGKMTKEDALFRYNRPMNRLLEGTWNAEMHRRYLRLHQMRIGKAADYERHQQAFATMPSWPSVGSVKVFGNEVIIKLGAKVAK